MKKIFLVIILMILLVWGCSHKTVPAKTETASAQPTTVTPIISPAIGDTALGKQTFLAKCGRCHKLKDPANYTTDKWATIMNRMSVKAKLDSTETQNVLAYVQANAKHL
jgi:hypothetical protein